MGSTEQPRATTPDEVMRLFVERANAGDAEGMAALYAEDAVLAYPPGREVRGRAAIHDACLALVGRGVRFGMEEQLPTIRCGDLALASSVSADGVGVRVQVLRRQADGAWLRVIDRPEAAAQRR